MAKIIFNHIYYFYFLLLFVIYIFAFIIGDINGLDDFYSYNSTSIEVDIPELQMSTSVDIFASILKNNLSVSVIFFISALFSFGLFPIVLIFYNGYIFGHISGCSIHILSLNTILSATLPHAFEFIGLIIFSTVGFYISSEYIIRHNFPKLGIVFSLILAGLFIIVLSAFIESFISIQLN